MWACRGAYLLIDGFGKEVYGFNFRDDDKILPGHDSGRGGYSFEENQFESDDPYHKMVPLIDGRDCEVRRANCAHSVRRWNCSAEEVVLTFLLQLLSERGILGQAGFQGRNMSTENVCWKPGTIFDRS